MTRKTTKKAPKVKNRRVGRWSAERKGKRIIAEHGSVNDVVGNAEPTADDTTYTLTTTQDTKPNWYDAPQQPGLHVLRTTRGVDFEYAVVRVILVDDGRTECFNVHYANGDGSKLDVTEYNNPAFQKVGE